MVSPSTLDNVTLLHILQLTCTTNDINVQHMLSYTQRHILPLVYLSTILRLLYCSELYSWLKYLTKYVSKIIKENENDTVYTYYFIYTTAWIERTKNGLCLNYWATFPQI